MSEEARGPAAGKPWKVPDVRNLTYGQYMGLCCVRCRRPLNRERCQVGVAQGIEGGYVPDVEVYACAPCSRRRAEA